jgi:hypothetical protein
MTAGHAQPRQRDELLRGLLAGRGEEPKTARYCRPSRSPAWRLSATRPCTARDDPGRSRVPAAAEKRPAGGNPVPGRRTTKLDDMHLRALPDIAQLLRFLPSRPAKKFDLDRRKYRHLTFLFDVPQLADSRTSNCRAAISSAQSMALRTGRRPPHPRGHPRADDQGGERGSRRRRAYRGRRRHEREPRTGARIHHAGSRHRQR